MSGYKHVHCRYQVLGYIGVEGEIVDVHQRRADAMRHAAACLGPRGYERTEVYDSMARRGEPNLWSVDQDGTTCVTGRSGEWLEPLGHALRRRSQPGA